MAQAADSVAKKLVQTLVQTHFVKLRMPLNYSGILDLSAES